MTGSGQKKVTEFQVKANQKGWTFKELGERWKLSERQVSRVAKAPTPLQLDALNGLPNKNEPPDMES